MSDQTMFVLACTRGTSDKLYVVSIGADSDGRWYVVCRWGRNDGRRMATKKIAERGWLSRWQAERAARVIAHGKQVAGGYYPLGPLRALTILSHQAALDGCNVPDNVLDSLEVRAAS